MIFDQRAKTHKNVVLFYKRLIKGMTAPTSGQDAPDALDFEGMICAYRTIEHHARAAEQAAEAEQYRVLAEIEEMKRR